MARMGELVYDGRGACIKASVAFFNCLRYMLKSGRQVWLDD